MKNLALVLAFLFVSLGAFAQKRSDLKGPEYKNYKPWKHKSEPTQVYTSNRKSDLKGPEYKNYKPSNNDSEIRLTAVSYGSERSQLTGPKYKNYKHFKKGSKENTSVAVN